MMEAAHVDLYRAIADCLSADPTLEELAAAVELVRSEHAAHWAILRALRDDDAHLADVAKRSYWHPNGFAKIVLHEAIHPAFKVRLHVWPRAESPAGSRGESNAHSHRWDFASTVFCGTGLEVRHYRIDSEGVPHDRYLWGPEFHGLQPTGGVRLQETLIALRPHRDVYKCDTSIVHTIEPRDDGLVATLVLQGPERCDTTEVYRRPDQAPERLPRDLSDRDLQTILDAVLAEI